MTTDFVSKILESEDVIYFPYCDWLFPNGLKINKVLFTIPWFNETSIDVYWYGFLIALGMLLAVIYGCSRLRKFGIDSDRAMDAVLAGLVGAIIGARAYYVIFRIFDGSGLYINDEGGLDIIKVLSIRDGGLAIYGGVIGALIFGCTVAKIRNVKLSPVLDLMGLGLLIGQCIGRWGNFFNQEAYGDITTLPWGMTSKTILNGLYFFHERSSTSIITTRATDLVAHPCFLYESLWCLLGFIILHIYSKKFRKFDGEIFLMYIGWYGAGRFWIEGLRTDSLYVPGSETLRVSQLVAGTCVLFAVIMLVVNYMSIRKNGGYTFYYETDESKELLRLRDEKIQGNRNRRGKDADAETDVHILADNVRDEEDSEETEETAETEETVESEESKEAEEETTDGEAD